MATVKFLLQKKGEKAPIYLRFSVNRKNVFKRKTGFFVNSDRWSTKTNLPTSQNTPENKRLKITLEKLATYINEQYNHDYADGKTIDGAWLQQKINAFNGQSNEDLHRLTNYIQHYIETSDIRQNAKGGIGLSRSRKNDFKALLRIVKEFEGKAPTKIKNVNIAYRNKFLRWLLDTKHYSKGYAGRIISNLKTVCTDAELNEIPTHAQLKKVSGFKVKNETVIYLTPEELKQIEETYITAPYLANAKKWLLFGCNIGQRGGDLLDITEHNFVTRNGYRYIELTQKKTGKSVAIPVSKRTKEILKNGLPYKISLQKFNDYIKEVCRLAGIDAPTTGQLIDPETKRYKVGEYPKYKLVSSHICRRSFASNNFGNDIPTSILMRITGHSSEKMFYSYIGKTSFDFAQQMAEYLLKQEKEEEQRAQMTILPGKASNQ
ncbi:tyrosine-type recombinase/integrase [Marinilabilia rubra]|uniref:Integrase n=1 Tax=Marinilabilia rubra TaxID=2162893 RepID=A0A2U2BD67_9BACT|nr:tyrosine-type recombinase/integrase [Marinilabilia rubra]PWE01000.1 integrase [Marinilabilia rubra]